MGFERNQFIELSEELAEHLKCGICFNTSDNKNFVIIEDYVFIRNIIVNSMVNELKTECLFEGCHLSLKFGQLFDHQRNCAHRLCEKCDFPIGSVVMNS